MLGDRKKTWRRVAYGAAGVIGIALFFYMMGPFADASVTPAFSFRIEKGEKFGDISDRLYETGVVRSLTVFKLWGLATGDAGRIKPGDYELAPLMNIIEVFDILVAGRKEVEVLIPEGSTTYDIETLLVASGVLDKGEFRKVALESEESLEGMFFPDTYKFFIDSKVEEVLGKLADNFKKKTESVLSKDRSRAHEQLVLASIVQREVPDAHDQKIIAGILRERMRIGMPLQVDISICYIKEQRSEGEEPCYPLSSIDFMTESPYNTYLHTGLPPTPIGNPGISALEAVRDPISSPYLFYLNDPETGKTIFSRTLDDHENNRYRYLLNRN